MKAARLVFIIGVIALLAGCSNIWAPPEAPAGRTGTVTLTVGQGSAGERTIYPSLSQFEKVILSFDTQSGAEVGDVKVEGGAVTLDLPEGEWSVTAKAFVNEEDDEPAAESSGANTLKWTGTGSVSAPGGTHFVLIPKPGPGTLQGVVAIPEGISLGAASRITVTRLGSSEPVYEAAITAPLNATASLPDGRYFVDIVLVDDEDGNTAVYQRTVVIGGGLTTELSFDAAGKFLSPEARAAQTVVDNLVFGLGGSNPPGTVIDTEDFVNNKHISIRAPNGTTAVSFTVTNPDGLTLTPKDAILESSSGGVSVFKADTTGISAGGGDLPVIITAVENDAMEGIPITVTVSVAPALTADIGFAQTVTNSSGLGSIDIEPINDATQSWTMAPKEKPVVYFAVNKEAGQTITVEDDDENRVTQAEEGVELDGSTAGDNLAVFAVNAERWDEETRTSNMFYGTGTHSVAWSPGNVADIQVPLIFEPVTFKLVASEENRAGKTVEVTVNTVTDLTGVAVFKVAGESLERVAKEDIRKWKIPESEGTTVIDALAWIDTGDVPGEYLVRVEADNQIPKSVLFSGVNGAIDIRLRGIGEERVITHDGNNPTGNVKTGTLGYAAFNSQGNIPNWSDILGLLNFYSVSVALEDKVTVKGLGWNTTLPSKSGDYIYRTLFGNGDGVFTMRSGSRVTEFNSNIGTHVIITLLQYSNGKFFMEGGSIDHNKVAKGSNSSSYGAIVKLVQASLSDAAKDAFIKTGGVVADNVRITISNSLEEEDFAKVSLFGYGEADLSEFER